MADDLAIMDVEHLASKLAELDQQSKIKVKELEKQIFELQEELKVAKVTPTTPVRDLPCFAPFRRPDGRIITSTVVPETTQWYHFGLLPPHEAIRRDMIEVDYLLKNHIKSDEPWKLVNLFSWFNKRFVVLVHAHHDGEEHLFFPAVKKRVNLPDKTTADHKVLLKGLDEINGIWKNFKENGGTPTNVEASMKTLPLLVAKWDEVTKLMLPHLAEEEEQLRTFIKDSFSKEEYDAVVKKIIKAEGLHGAKIFLPSIIESMDMWGTEQNRKEIAKELPFPIRFMLKHFWTNSYRKYHRGVLNSLRSGAPMQVIIE